MKSIFVISDEPTEDIFLMWFGWFVIMSLFVIFVLFYSMNKKNCINDKNEGFDIDEIDNANLIKRTNARSISYI